MNHLSVNRMLMPVLGFVLVLFFMVSCQKENSVAPSVTEEEAAALSEESSGAEASYDDVSDIAFTAADEEGDAAGFGVEGRTYLPLFEGLRARIGNCATVTVFPNDSTYPKTITIDFGDGCTGADGKLRKGKMVLHLTAPVRRPGAVATLTFVNFYLNRAHIEGSVVFTNQSDLPQHKWSLAVINGKLTYPNGRGYQYEGVKHVAQIAGMATRRVIDDVYKIEGRSKTEFNNGKTINLNTKTPLIKKVACHWISEGTLKIKINDRVLKLDYGFPNNGNCDNKALLTWNDGNNQRIVILP